MTPVRRIGRWLGRGLLGIAVPVALLWTLGPRVPVAPEGFDAAALSGDLDVYLSAAEARVPDLREGVARRIVWAGAPGQATAWSVLYLHGFSASSEEIRPVPDRVAEALGANLHFARLRGHGRDGAALGAATAGAWLDDTAEALAIARRIGERVLVIATSTGGSLALLALEDGAAGDVAGLVLVSPNLAVNNPLAPLLTWPAAQHWLPLLAGNERSFTPLNDGQAAYWTTRYPSVAVFPMAAVVARARAIEVERIGVPMLLISSADDRVVRADAADDMAGRWGGPVTRLPVAPGPGVDPNAHVLAGDIMSPAMTAPVTEAILAFARGL